MISFWKTGITNPFRRRQRNRRKRLAANRDRMIVFDRQRDIRGDSICYAFGISPVCTQWAMDPHELIPQGRGGPQVSWNRVAVCRACHRAAQGSVGGNRLQFDWPGKADGQPPNADIFGNVSASWRIDYGTTGHHPTPDREDAGGNHVRVHSHA